MARDLPARIRENGLETGKNGRDHHGRFLPGNPGGGRPRNPYARAQAQLRCVMLEHVTERDVRAVVDRVLALAKGGNLAASEQLFRWIIGPPPEPTHPDFVAAHELQVRRSLPTLVDLMTLADEQADREPGAIPATAAEEPDDADPHAPALRTVLAWAIQELAEAQTALRASHPPPPDPVASWEAFAASRLELTPEAAVPVDLLLLAYMRWCGAHGEPVLAEAKVLTWLEQHGASFRTGTLSQVTTVVGVRLVE